MRQLSARFQPPVAVSQLAELATRVLQERFLSELRERGVKRLGGKKGKGSSATLTAKEPQPRRGATIQVQGKGARQPRALDGPHRCGYLAPTASGVRSWQLR